jgi:peptide/nickel transport system substrate-binding protein
VNTIGSGKIAMRLVWILVLLAAPMLAPVARAQKSADTLRWVSAYPIDALDPYFNVSREIVIITQQEVWDTLIWRDPASGDYKPLLAKSWKWIDPTTLEFVLRDDVKFQDGKPLTAADAVYTYNYIGDAGHKIPMQQNVSWIKGAEQTGPYSFRLMLKGPFPPALEFLSSLLPVLPADFYGDGGKAPPVEKAFGTGPYRITRFTPGVSMDVEATGSYFAGPKGQPGIKRINYRRIPDNSTQIAELLSGGADWIWNVPTDQAPKLAQSKGLTVKGVETMRLSFIQFNLRDMPGGNPLQNLKVRQAVAHAIDRAGIVKDMIGNGSQVPKAFCYPSQFGCEQDVAQYDYDPDAAKKMLAEAGFKPGTTLELQAFRSRDWTDAVGGQLDAVGISPKIDFIPYAAGQQHLARNEMQMYLQDNGWFSINDVYAVVNPYFGGDAYDSTQDKTLTDWVHQAATSTDAALRKDLYSKILKRVAEQMYVLPMWSHPNIHAYRSDLDLVPYSDENPRFYLARWKQ